MIQSLFIGIALLVSFFGLLRTPTPIWDTPSLRFGATSFPASLDSLTNPSGTDSVATVSHSGQHSNANDSIEAIEAKIGTGASTPVNNTLFAGTGAGSSAWVTYATTTNLQSTNITATGSSTLQNFTGLQSTSTNATTTNFFTTTASTTNLFGANINGFSLSTCTGTNLLQWSGGSFLCTVAGASGITITSTTTVNNMATSSVDIPAANNVIVRISIPNIVGGGATTSASLGIRFNNDQTAKYAVARVSRGAAEVNDQTQTVAKIVTQDGNFRTAVQTQIEFTNFADMDKIGHAVSAIYATTTNSSFSDSVPTAIVHNDVSFIWVNETAQASTMQIGFDLANVFMGTSTRISVMGW